MFILHFNGSVIYNPGRLVGTRAAIVPTENPGPREDACTGSLQVPEQLRATWRRYRYTHTCTRVDTEVDNCWRSGNKSDLTSKVSETTQGWNLLTAVNRA